MRAVTSAMFAFAATAAFCSAPLSPQCIRWVQGAANDAESGNRPKALACLESLLMGRRVTVGVDSTEPDGLSQSIGHAIGIWAGSLDDSPFQVARRGETPDFRVRLVSDISSGGDVQGLVDANRRLTWGAHGHGFRITGTILVRRAADGKDLSANEVTSVIAHELGHLLGLDDRRDLVGLMGPFVMGHPRMQPAKDEIEAVQGFRRALRVLIVRVNGSGPPASRGTGSRGHRVHRIR